MGPTLSNAVFFIYFELWTLEFEFWVIYWFDFIFVRCNSTFQKKILVATVGLNLGFYNRVESIFVLPMFLLWLDFHMQKKN